MVNCERLMPSKCRPHIKNVDMIYTYIDLYIMVSCNIFCKGTCKKQIAHLSSPSSVFGTVAALAFGLALLFAEGFLKMGLAYSHLIGVATASHLDLVSELPVNALLFRIHTVLV